MTNAQPYPRVLRVGSGLITASTLVACARFHELDPARVGGCARRDSLGIICKPGSDMTIGVASNATSSVVAIRVAGTSAQAISDAMVATRTLNSTTTKEDLELGGKQVLKVTTTIAPFPFYVYATGDVSFTVAAADETIAAEAFSKLP